MLLVKTDTKCIAAGHRTGTELCAVARTVWTVQLINIGSKKEAGSTSGHFAAFRPPVCRCCSTWLMINLATGVFSKLWWFSRVLIEYAKQSHTMDSVDMIYKLLKPSVTPQLFGLSFNYMNYTPERLQTNKQWHLSKLCNSNVIKKEFKHLGLYFHYIHFWEIITRFDGKKI